MNEDAARLLDEEKRQPPPEVTEEVSHRLWSRLSTSMTVTSAAGLAGAKLLGALVGTFVLGAAVGTGVTLALRPVELPPAVPPAPVVQAPTVTEPPAPVDAGVALVPAPKPKPSLTPTPTPKSLDDQSLAREQTMLDVGRAALVQGRGAEALAAALEHRARFPRGQLAEERDALEVQALWLLGRRDEARTRGSAFRQAYPESVFLPVMEGIDATP